MVVGADSTAAGLVVTPHQSIAGQSVRRVQMADLLPDECEQFPPVDGIGAEAGSRMVCAYLSGSIQMTASLWQRVIAKHQELGRMLTDEELGEAVHAESGVDHDA